MRANSFIMKYLRHVTPSVVLIFFTVLAMFFANMPVLKDWYFRLWQFPLSVSFGGFNFFSHNGNPLTLGEFVNDFLMAIFFLAVGLEIKREILIGELSTREKAMLPIIGACGGMLVPVLIFLFICPSDAVMQRGTAIPMATDIAFSLGILAIFSDRVPAGLKIFLAALAVADDLGGILVIAIFYSSDINFTYLLLSALCLVIMIAANYFNCRRKSFYVILGLALWYMMLNSGIHATIAGVLTAFCIPAFFGNSVSETDKTAGPLQFLEYYLRFPINYIIVPLFAFVNAGIDFSQMSIGGMFTGVGLAVMLGLVIGKFLGVFSFCWASVRLKIVTLPDKATWSSFASVCVICGIGFTVSLFIADLSYSGFGLAGDALLSQAKLGVISGSIVSAVLGIFLLDKTLPKTSKKEA